VLLANPRWERHFVKFLELSGVGRVMADGTDEMTLAPRGWMSGWYGRCGTETFFEGARSRYINDFQLGQLTVTAVSR
jgi:hypothetical protein